MTRLIRRFRHHSPTPSVAGPGYSYTGEVVRRSPARVTAPSHGPWAEHGLNCKCNVCR